MLSELIHVGDYFHCIGNCYIIYQLYNCGKIVDEYFSAHDIFDFDAVTSYSVSGDVGAVCSAFGKNENAHRLESILKEEYEYEHKRHRDLVRTLGLPDFAVCSGYTTIRAGEMPSGVQAHEFARTL